MSWPTASPPDRPGTAPVERSGSASGPASPPQVLARLPDPESLHPSLWRAYQLARGARRGWSSGHPALDAQLPGGGWPPGALTELMLPHWGVGELRLLAPCLAEVLRTGRLVMLFDPPARLSAWGLAQLGLEPEGLCIVQGLHGSGSPRSGPARRATAGHAAAPPGMQSAWGTEGTQSQGPGGGPRVGPAGGDAGGDGLWALEQALKSGHVGALLAWLPPRLRPERLRRLQLAAQAHDGPIFLLREWAAMERPSPAPLRLSLRAAGPDRLAVRLLKRRGPWHAQALTLALPSMLPPSMAAQLALESRGAAGPAAGSAGRGGPVAVPPGHEALRPGA